MQATIKKQGASQKAGWAFVVAAQITPRVEDEVIIAIAAGLMLPEQMAYHVLETNQQKPQKRTSVTTQ